MSVLWPFWVKNRTRLSRWAEIAACLGATKLSVAELRCSDYIDDTFLFVNLAGVARLYIEMAVFPEPDVSLGEETTGVDDGVPIEVPDIAIDEDAALGERVRTTVGILGRRTHRATPHRH